MVKGLYKVVEKLTDNMASARLSCPTLSCPSPCVLQTMILLTSQGYITAVALSMHVTLHPLGHKPLLFCLSLLQVLPEDPRLVLPRENKHVCSPHGSSGVFPAYLVMPCLPWAQCTVQEARQKYCANVSFIIVKPLVPL